MKFSSVLKQAYIIFKTNWIKNVFKGKLFSISSYEILTNVKQIVPNLEMIIDVGANSGQFTKTANHFYPNASIYTFEPLEDHFLKIKNEFSKNEKIKIYNLALGNQENIIMFNKNKYGHVSSILEISEENKYYPNEEITKVEVKLTTLDLFFKNTIPPNNTLLKLDVQGFELEVLKGAKNILKNIEYVIIEANLEKLYTNQPTFTEVNSFLNENEFELHGMLDFNLGNKNRYIEIDLLYKRK